MGMDWEISYFQCKKKENSSEWRLHVDNHQCPWSVLGEKNPIMVPEWDKVRRAVREHKVGCGGNTQTQSGYPHYPIHQRPFFGALCRHRISSLFNISRCRHTYECLSHMKLTASPLNGRKCAQPERQYKFQRLLFLLGEPDISLLDAPKCACWVRSPTPDGSSVPKTSADIQTGAPNEKSCSRTFQWLQGNFSGMWSSHLLLCFLFTTILSYHFIDSGIKGDMDS